MSCVWLLDDGGDIIAHVMSRQTEVFDNYMKYILNQDSIMLEGKQGGLLFQERRPVHNLQQRKYPFAARLIYWSLSG
jgi:hypothetical protein